MAKNTVSSAGEEFNPHSLKVMRTEISDALQAVANRHGVTFELGNIGYTPSSFNVRLEAKRPESDQRQFEQYAADFGLKPSDFGATFVCNGTKYTISGINPRSRTYPIIVTREDGESSRFREDAVRKALGVGSSHVN
jgi:hypothetical protein